MSKKHKKKSWKRFKTTMNLITKFLLAVGAVIASIAGLIQALK